MTHAPANRAGTVLMGAGAALTALAAAYVAFLVLGDPPTWAWSMLALAPWGPILLGFGIVVTRFARRAARLHATGLRVRAPIAEIRPTSSQHGSSPVLRLSVAVDPSRTVVIRTAVPAHLVGALRTGKVLPVLVDPADPSVAIVDWQAAEREL